MLTDNSKVKREKKKKKNSKGNRQRSNLYTYILRFSYSSISFVIVPSLSRLGNERFDSPRLLRVTPSKNFVDALSEPRYVQIKGKMTTTTVLSLILMEEKNDERKKIRFPSNALRIEASDQQRRRYRFCNVVPEPACSAGKEAEEG